MHQGQCLCGSVKITTSKRTDNIDVCHCGMCQRWNGGPGFTIDCDDDIRVDGENAVVRFASSAWGERAFCKQCGTHLFYHLHSPSKYFVYAALFDESKDATLATQIYVDSKPAYYSFREKTVMLTEQDIIKLMQQ
ncbi:MAG: hypothetical protein XXXJIFNMEKO3_01548 [Candidatus Erwinia impunctatus]|nr:hypothetical protein XXXJIFNMEKO_01548 [Culicoides impunctatus]